MSLEPVTDEAWVTYQLGRAPRQMSGVVRRCATGVPMVIETQPLPETSAGAFFFPTLFWLTCPVAIKAVSRLEDEGWVQRWQAWLASDADVKGALLDAQKAYLQLRLDRVGAEARAQLQETHPALWKNLCHRGIGGVADWETVKCLHMHLAHYWSGHANPIGQWVEAQITVHSACRACWDAEQVNPAGVAK